MIQGRFALVIWLTLHAVSISCETRSQTSQPMVATFSIVAFDADAKEWGVAVQSKFVAVGSLVPWAKAGAARSSDMVNARVLDLYILSTSWSC